jgi:Ca2+-binding RTX toxin-like protein
MILYYLLLANFNLSSIIPQLLRFNDNRYIYFLLFVNMWFTVPKNVDIIRCASLLIFALLATSPMIYSQVQAKVIDGENIQDIFCFVTASGKASELKTFDVKDNYQAPFIEKTKTKGSSSGTSHDESETEGHNHKSKFESDSAALEQPIIGTDPTTGQDIIIGGIDADGDPADEDKPFEHIPGTLSHNEGNNKRNTFESETDGKSHQKGDFKSQDKVDKDDVELKKFTVKNKFRVVETPINDANRKIDGTAQGDVLMGSGCLDTIHGNGGNDFINGDGDADRLYGDAGDDTIVGNFGSDQIYGGPGNDDLFGGDDSDIIFGEDGNDKIYGGTGDNLMKGGAGKDYFDCGPDHNIILDFNSTQGDVVADNCKDARIIGK